MDTEDRPDRDIVVPPVRSELNYVLGKLTRESRELDVRRRLDIRVVCCEEAGEEDAKAQVG